jgi:hypothetical protein
MKNVHVLPTDKPSRLIIYSRLLNEFRLLDEPLDDWKHKRNIYITSDEQIKYGDWHIYVSLNAINKRQRKNPLAEYPYPQYQKIILTTDQDLIKDGVQAIDDEFLEWFVKNPSCEFVEVENEMVASKLSSIERWDYELRIIPQEEPNQETLEEAAERMAKEHCSIRVNPNTTEFQIQQFIIKGAKWQAERMYSEKDMKQFAWECVANFLSNRDNKVEMELVEVIINRNSKQFEQFKKK